MVLKALKYYGISHALNLRIF